MTQYEIYEDLITKMGYTSYQVSKATGISQAALSAWKKRNGATSAANLKKIADYLNVDMDVFLGSSVRVNTDDLFKWFDFVEQIDDETYILIEMKQKMSHENKERLNAVIEAMFPVEYAKAKETVEKMNKDIVDES